MFLLRFVLVGFDSVETREADAERLFEHLEALVRCNVLLMARWRDGRGRRIPRLMESGIRWQDPGDRDPPIVDAATAYAMAQAGLDAGGGGDLPVLACGTIAAYYVAELRHFDRDARAKIVLRNSREQVVRDGRSRTKSTWHILGRRGDEELVDPCRMVGM